MEPAVKRLLPPDSSSGAASHMMTLAPCSCAASAAQNAALPAPITITSADSFAIPVLLLLRRLGDAAVRLRPRRRIVHELFDFRESGFVEFAALLGDRQHVPPGGERMQRHAEIAENLFAFGKDVVEEEHKDVLDHGAGVAKRLAEIDLAAPVGGHVLDEEDALARLDLTFDLGVAAKTLWLLAHILHGQHQPLGHPGGERNSRGLAAGHRVELLEPG